MKPTVGIDFLSRNLTIHNSTYRLQLWDTAGQEKYKSLVPAYLRDANAAIFVYDLTRKESLQNLRNWVQLYRQSKVCKGTMHGK
jgi:Ras-related protein Rab-6A